MKKNLFIIVFAFLSMPFAWAQQPNPEYKESFKALRKASREYIKTEVMPTVKEWRQDFDSKLSSEEKSIINEVRASLEANKEEGRELRKELRQLHKAGEQPTEEQKAQMKAMRDARHASMQRLCTVVESHREELKKQREANIASFERWSAALTAIKQEHIGELELQRPHHHDGMREGGRRGHRNGEHTRGHHKFGNRAMGPMKRFLSPHGFLLLDPNKEMPEDDFGMEEGGMPADLKMFPNPAKAQQRITFEMKEGGYANIELLDGQGSKIKTIASKDFDQGMQHIDVGTEELEPGMYLYRITTAQGTITKRFMKR